MSKVNDQFDKKAADIVVKWIYDGGFALSDISSEHICALQDAVAAALREAAREGDETTAEEFAELSKQITEHQKAQIYYMEQCDRLKLEVAETKATYNKTVERLEREIAKLKAKIEQLEAELIARR